MDTDNKNNEKINSTKDYYNGIAQGYKNLYHEEQILKLNYVKDKFPKVGKVLDAGCGDGVLNQFIYSDCELYSFDLSEELLKLNNNISNRKFCGSLTDLSIFEDNYFNFISTFSVIQDIPNFELVFDEFIRVLKDDGILFLSFVKFSLKREKILEIINLKFEVVEEFEETKDLIFILKIKK